MRRLSKIVRLAGILISACSAARASAELTVGDPPPRFAPARWVKGDAIERLSHEKTYVIEFWATWCGPCHQASPHLSELQKKYGEAVTVVGVSVWEPDVTKVAPFVEKMGSKMAYRVAVDEPSMDRSGSSGGTIADGWLVASGEEGLPVAFIVSGGLIAWIGHPMDLDEPLAKVVAGNWDIVAAANERRQARDSAAQVKERMDRAMGLVRERKFQAAITDLDASIAAMPRHAQVFMAAKISVYLDSKDDAALIAAGAELLESEGKEKANLLNYLARVIVTSEDIPEGEAARRRLDLALKASEQANSLTHDTNPKYLDTLARVHFEKGDSKRAAEVLEQALRRSERDIPEWRSRLEVYRNAARLGPK